MKLTTMFGCVLQTRPCPGRLQTGNSLCTVPRTLTPCARRSSRRSSRGVSSSPHTTPVSCTLLLHLQLLLRLCFILLNFPHLLFNHLLFLHLPFLHLNFPHISFLHIKFLPLLFLHLLFHRLPLILIFLIYFFPQHLLFPSSSIAFSLSSFFSLIIFFIYSSSSSFLQHFLYLILCHHIPFLHLFLLHFISCNHVLFLHIFLKHLHPFLHILFFISIPYLIFSSSAFSPFSSAFFIIIFIPHLFHRLLFHILFSSFSLSSIFFYLSSNQQYICRD